MQAAMKSHSSVAITGSAYRFPGDARSHESYWALLDSGRSVIRNTPVDRFDIEPFFNQDGAVCRAPPTRVAADMWTARSNSTTASSEFPALKRFQRILIFNGSSTALDA
jgi:hypothetical protein